MITFTRTLTTTRQQDDFLTKADEDLFTHSRSTSISHLLFTDRREDIKK